MESDERFSDDPARQTDLAIQALEHLQPEHLDSKINALKKERDELTETFKDQIRKLSRLRRVMFGGAPKRKVTGGAPKPAGEKSRQLVELLNKTGPLSVMSIVSQTNWHPQAVRMTLTKGRDKLFGRRDDDRWEAIVKELPERAA